MVAKPDTPNSPESALPQPARKQVTVLFCDVVDYTSRSVSLDPEDLADEIRVFQTLCGGIAEKYHGRIANYLGDGLLVLFGHPVASEFDPEHAVRAGLEMVAGIKGSNASEQWRGRAPIRIRVGIATGLVVVGERAGVGRDRDELIFGEAPNLAARLQSLAEPDSVVTALRTRRLVGGAFKFRDLGEHAVKGFAQLVNAWQLLHESTFQNRSTTSLKRVTTRFVSRRKELQRLQENYARALGGQCRIVHLSGDPGIGKSRLLRAFEKSAGSGFSRSPKGAYQGRYVQKSAGSGFSRSPKGAYQGRYVQKSAGSGFSRSPARGVYQGGHAQKSVHKQDFHRLRVTCSPYFRNSPFKPVVDETHRWLQIGDHDDPETRRENIHRAMLAIDLDGRDEHALFDELLAIPELPDRPRLDISAEEKHHRTVDALTSFVIRLSRLRPLLLVVEDLHWADPSTLEVLGGIISRGGAEKLFAVFTSRTGFVPPWPAEKWLVEMKLGGLDASSSACLITAVSGARALPDAVTETLIRKSGGVPLFLEETSRHLLDQMGRDEVRDSAAGAPDNAFTVPDTLQDSLNARLDQLGEAKAFAQLAAVFGGDFRYSLISKVAGQNAISADAGMDVLLEADLLLVSPDKAEDRYAFRHALFQDAAYHSLLKKTRQRYHLQIAELLQQDNPDVGRQHPELIAHHYSHTERTDRAVDLWLRAGQQAIAQSAVNEALRHLSQGLRLARKLPEGEDRNARELALLLNLGVALTARSGYHGERVTRTYEKALALAEAGGDDQQVWIGALRVVALPGVPGGVLEISARVGETESLKRKISRPETHDDRLGATGHDAYGDRQVRLGGVFLRQGGQAVRPQPRPAYGRAFRAGPICNHPRPRGGQQTVAQ